VDLIIGADLIIKIDNLLGENTDFGWIVSGCTKSKGSYTVVATTIECKDLVRFRELEEESKEDLESEICKENFTKTTQIDSSGRYVVKMLFLPKLAR